MRDKKAIKLNHNDFVEVVKNAPLVSIDLIVKNDHNQVLLGLRKNKPAKNYWFVPGGRILKNERIADAFERIADDELGINLAYKDAEFLGVFEHLYPKNLAQKQEFGIHYVVLAYQVKLTQALPNLPKTQHSRYQWFSKQFLCKDKKVHPYTRVYFKNDCKNRKL